MAGLAAVPVVTDVRAAMERVREAELAAALRRLGDVTPEQREAIEYLSKALMNKFLHEPSVRLREAAANGRGLGIIDAARFLFGVPGGFTAFKPLTSACTTPLDPLEAFVLAPGETRLFRAKASPCVTLRDSSKHAATATVMEALAAPRKPLDLPPGATVAESHMEGTTLLVRISSAGGDEIFVIDPHAAKVIARVKLNKAPAGTSPP